MTTQPLHRRAVAEGLGTAGLVLSAFGGGHLAAKLGASPAEGALIGTLAVAGTLVAVLHAIGSLTGGHVNPAVTLSVWITRALPGRDAAAYIGLQVLGALGGAGLANFLWDATPFQFGSGSVEGMAYLAEILAAGGLVALIHGTASGGAGDRLPLVVPAFVVAASFGAPFGFANPAVALAKSIAGSGPGVPSLAVLLVCELSAAVLAALAMRWLYGLGLQEPAAASEVAEATANAEAGATAETGSLDTAPTGVSAYEIVCAARSPQCKQVARNVIEQSVRPNDVVVEHPDGRLMLLLDATDPTVIPMLEQRINANITAAVKAAALSTTPIMLRPAGLPNQADVLS